MATSPYDNAFLKQDQGCFLVSRCCFCIPLKTGCFILGYISLFLNFIITLFFVGTTAFLAIYTHGFRYIHTKQNENGEQVPDENSVMLYKLNMTVVCILLVASLNVAWFLMNIVLLVGLHRKRPGHIKFHVSVAIIRLLLSVVGIVMYGAHTPHSLFACCSEIALSAYFILLYYVYAVQLEREQKLIEIRPVSDIIADIVFSYPKNMDKLTLTAKDNKFVVV